ncbi:membrane protein [Pandoraea communis]|uniref:Membrane protein n=2 Tax=Pandoraea communis TaxID=2508297 RepID=A0A5E4XK80_9BURK|nr:membrane protein [Pandoraea communis]
MGAYDQDMVTLIVLFGTVFVLNVVPAFAPPTWMVLSWTGFRQPDLNPVLMAVVAALAATGGRVVLAKGSHWLILGRLMRDIDRQNIAVAAAWLGRKKTMTATVFLLYAFSPLPSNYLFIAYGLTGLGLKTIALAFFLGRTTSYLAWTSLAQFASAKLEEKADALGGYPGIYFVGSQLVLLGLIYGLSQLDWLTLLNQHKIRFIKRPPR